MTDSPALHPLHSAAAIRKQRRSAIASFRRPQTAETVRKRRARPKKDSRGRDAPHIGQDQHYGRETSSGQDTAIRREAPPVAEDTVVARAASPGKTTAIVAGTVQLSQRSAGCACEIGRPRRWTPQPAVSDCPGRPKSGHHSATFHRRGLRFIGFALSRLCRERVQQTRRKLPEAAELA